ncbi:MFS general substrate transporter [Linderina pennispora]|uniref:MFS general substrate transporter n=1 Tax=Linderina pennispora TaxID=61395 RepID=A0A1Y1W8D1_9FUNG|nr:MFS general substrate transporter [Linderina pennispora]ORX69645.1 MFS general substrate transporter [Linderina pennispora]
MGFLPYFAAKTQIVILGFICFGCPGMFNALNGTGGGGQVDREAGNNANTALYVCFIISGLFGGAIVNKCGVRFTMFISGLTYALYSGSYIYINHTGKSWFTIWAGAMLGLGAGIFWTAQGMIMMSYPLENEKGKFITIFWVIFNLGGVLGGVILLGTNYNHEGSLSDGAYAAFLAIEIGGSLCALVLAPPSKVVRTDGSHVEIKKVENVMSDAIAILKLFADPWMIILIPMMFSSNFYYSYQFGPYNGSLFTTRTKGFNNIWYWGAQMVTSGAFTRLLDRQSLSRKKRALYGVLITLAVVNAVWGGTLKMQNKYTHGALATTPPTPTDYPGGAIDFKDTARAAGPCILYACMGIQDALWNNMAYWLLGTITNDASRLARYAGFYKAIQSVGAAVSWQLDAKSVAFRTQLIVNWVLLVISALLMVYLSFRVKEQTDGEDHGDFKEKYVDSDSEQDVAAQV